MSIPLTLFLLFTAFGSPWLQQPQPSPEELVSASNARSVVVRSRPAIEVEILNTTSQVLTAWKVEVNYRLSDGRIQSQAKTTDVYAAAVESLIAGKSPAPGGGSIRETFLLPGPSGTSIEISSAKVVWAIFEDGTWIGPEAAIQVAFHNRAREQAAWAYVADSLRIGRGVGGREGLTKSLEHLRRPDQEDFDNPIKKIMRNNFKRAVEQDPTILAEPQVFFASWTSRVETRLLEAAASRQQKGRRTTR
jgi:hypothetical protein